MTKHKILSVLGFLGMVIAILGLLARDSIFGRGPVSILLQVIAIFLMLWARLTFGFRSFHLSANPTSGGLVTNGPYRFLRHPIYGAVLLFIFTAIVSNFSIENAALGLLGTAGALVRIFTEESLLRREFTEYTAYAKRTKRLIPFIF
ncbi:MAG: isoprenylcysteine carboxylmethyltransferase family protein [Acidobacteria bacterium]|nr:isoprenylcysteine carboxylmethyltransferase family protein [Acidobacteriota bacterium]